MKILVVDDEPGVRRIAAYALTKIGKFQVIEADCAETGIRMAEEERPDVVLFDVMLGDMSGFEAVSLLRRRPGMADVPILMFTALADEISLDVVQSLGLRGVVGKPFDPMALVETVRKLIETEDDPRAVPLCQPAVQERFSKRTSTEVRLVA